MADSINIGNITVNKFYLGNSDDVQIYLGTVKLYPQDTPVTKDYLRTVARDSGTITLTIGSAVTTSDLSYVAYSLDSGSTWTTVNNVDDTAITASTNVSNGDVVYWKGSGIRTANGSAQYNGVDYTSIFSSDAAFDVEGNAMSILFDDNFENQEFDSGSTYHLSSLFYSATTLVNASGLTLPATTVYENDYNDMFNNCSGLTSVPILSATTLGASCYKRIFRACRSLQSVPSNYLPITTLANECYDNMFRDCSGLTTAPSLPATTLADTCYRSMFLGCKSLTTAPILSATTLAPYCYCYMFNGCTSLTTAPSLPATTLADTCYQNMFSSCSSLTTAPSLPATTLANYCYQNMFSSCSSLTTAPSLPATTLANYCYQNMFSSCSSLNYIECNAVTNAIGATNSWVYGVASSGTFIKNSGTTWWTTSINGIPTNWSVGTLPAERQEWRKADVSDYVCDTTTYTKYYKEYLKETTDGGITWSYVTPITSRTSSSVIEYDSVDCGYVPQVSYFTIRSLANDNTIKLTNNADSSIGITWFEYSLDSGTTWNSFSLRTGETRIFPTLGVNETIMMKGTNDTLGTSYNKGHFFRGTADYEVEGSIASLVTGSNTDTKLSGKGSYTFAQLFSGDTHLVSAENLKISSVELPQSCFNGTFRACTRLVKAPDLSLPTVLGKECYSSMFEGCIALAYPPTQLYFTIAQSDSYNRMFCMSRTSKITTPAMTYTPKMFGDWGSISPNSQQMFCGNGNLTDIYCYWTNTSGRFANMLNWVNYTADSGVTFNKRSAQSFVKGVSGIKTGWTVVNDDTIQPS